MSKQNINLQFFPLNSNQVAEDFLLQTFGSSKNKLKKYFDKKFLKRELLAQKPIEIDINFANDGEINPVYDGPQIEIIFEDENFIVLNKPHNIFVHPLTYNESNNCLSFLRSIGKLPRVNINEYDRGLLYRLDFETSGILVITKKNEIYTAARSGFESLVKEKIYQLKVSGNLKQKGIIEHSLKASGENGSKIKIVETNSSDSFLASLEVLDVKFNEQLDESLVTVKLITGHRHQIRVQMMGLGHPIIGDTLYGGRASDRLFLHAYRYDLQVFSKQYSWVKEAVNF